MCGLWHSVVCQIGTRIMASLLTTLLCYYSYWCVVLIWPWKWFGLGKDDCLLLVHSNQCFPIKNTFGWSAVVFCACEMVQLFFVVFSVGSAVYKFTFWFVIDKTNSSSLQWQTHVCDCIYKFFPSHHCEC